MPPRALSSALPPWKNGKLCPWRLAVRRRYTQTAKTAEQPRGEHEEPHPTPSQFLRFALSGTTHTQGQNPRRDGALDEHLERIFATPYVSERQKNNLFSPTPGKDFNGSTNNDHKDDHARLPEILRLIDKRVKSAEAAQELKSGSLEFTTALEEPQGRVQYEELLASLNAVVARLNKFEVGPGRAICLRGLFYASICCSPSALQHHVSQYLSCDCGMLPNKVADEIITLLLDGLRSREASGEEDPASLRHWMREVLEGPDTAQKADGSFHWLLKLTPHELKLDWVGKYTTLLGEIKATRTLSQVWAKLAAQIHQNREWMENMQGLRSNVNSCLQAFVDCGEARSAITAARDISQFIDLNRLISIDLWKLLLLHDTSGILRDLPSQQTARQVLHREVSLIGTNMGIAWAGPSADRSRDGDRHVHDHHWPTYNAVPIPLIDTSNPDEFSNLLDLTCNTPATIRHASHHLLSLIQTLTHSTSPSPSLSSLTHLANTLVEYEGTTIPLGANTTLQHEFAWFPHTSPLEFTGHETLPGCVDPSATRDAAGLGLLRVRRVCGDEVDAPLRSDESMHLMQLGYIGARKLDTSTQNKIDEGYIPTGHVLGWDRQHGGFRLIWVGLAPGLGPQIGIGTVLPGAVPGTPPDPLPYASATIEMRGGAPRDVMRLDAESIQHFYASKNDNGESLAVGDRESDVVRHWVDLDPGYDLR